MKSIAKNTILLLMFLFIPAMAMSQTDLFGKPDTVYAELAKINESTWTITISVTNDEWIQALSLPFELQSGKTKVVGDSAVYAGGRVESFSFKGFRADTTIQCITMGLLANMGPTKNFMTPGNGRVVTVFVSSLDGSPIEKLSIDTTTTAPNNALQMIANGIQFTSPPDTIPQDRFDDLLIVPAFVVKKSE